MKRSLLLFLLSLKFCQTQYVTPQYAEIRAVSAMCSSDGITASIDFDKPFTGKIYSLNYAAVNDCLYYNNIDRDTVLFSIPAHICGTKLQRTTRNMIDQMENRVYVQMDKDTQTSADKQFSFVCRLTDPLKGVAKDNGEATKDSYQQEPIRPVASSVSTKMHSSLMPIKPSEVRQVSAFSRDSHLGNWPIPGAKPYEPSMKPVSTYPMSPISPEISSATHSKDVTEGYVTRPISSVGLTPLPAPLFPNIPPPPPIQRSPPAVARVFTTSTPTPIFFTFPTSTTPPLPFPIIPNVHFKQGVGVPFAPVTAPSTKVDASKWNDPNAYATAPTITNSFDSTTPKPEEKSYREQPPTADAPFSSDHFNNNNNEIVEPTKTAESEVRRPQADDPNRHTVTSVLKTTQEQQIEPEVTLEIQRGEGPFAPPVTTPIKIGDNISLVVKAKSYLNDTDQFDMFVHSCFATDGKGTTKVQMIDENGCVIRREFASPLHRAKDAEQIMFYYVMIKAFKFPGPDDVYFSCTIEFTPMTKAPNICSKLRRRREVLEPGTSEMRLFDSVSVELEDGETSVKTDSEYYDDLYTQYNMNMKATTSASTNPRLSLDSGIGLTNDSFYSTDLNESQLMDLSASTASDTTYVFKSGPLEFSPPTKWARVRTPPNRKKSTAAGNREETNSDINLFTPPSRKRVRSFMSPTGSLRTPDSLRKSIRISSPSPFKVTISKTPLKLSNNENVTGFHIGKTGTYYNKTVSGSASKRCLLHARPDGFTDLKSPNSDVLDLPLEADFDDFGLLFPIITPEKSNKVFESTDDAMDYHQYAGMIENGTYNSCPASAPVLSVPLASSREEPVSKSTPLARTASRNLLKTNKESFAIVTHHPLPNVQKEAEHMNLLRAEAAKSKTELVQNKLPSQLKKQSVKDEMVREAKEKEMQRWKKTPFETPKKELPLYSGRWLVISTGRTLAQQELLSDARNFFRTHRPSPSLSALPKAPVARRIPTIARVTLFKHHYRTAIPPAHFVLGRADVQVLRGAIQPPNLMPSAFLVPRAMAFVGLVWMVHSDNSTDSAAMNNNTILTNQTQSLSQQLSQLTGNTLPQVEDVMDAWLGKRQWDLTSSVKFDQEVLTPLRNLRVALLVVDFQNDFVDGSLKIGDGDAGQDPNKAISPLNDLLQKDGWDLVVYTKDWHPHNHISFLSQAHNSDREMDKADQNRTLNYFDSVQFLKPIKTEQILYPDHCIQGSWGSDIHPEVRIVEKSQYIMKGVDPYLDSYSAFFDNNGRSKTELEDVLHRENIDAVVIAGLAYDICVRFTCLDAVKQKFLAAVVPECSAGLTKKGIAESEEAFKKNGVAIISKDDAQSISEGGYLPQEWVRNVALGKRFV
ncbi:unnamed protein product [Caenorhabditis sp. 36 PRJEB53466]|nr:unnamed protein product [Caenorhabditis sp. 36 PRJEB53466]